MTKHEAIVKLNELRNPDIKVSTFNKHIDELIAYVQSVGAKPMNEIKKIEISWLQRRIMDDIANGKCKTDVFMKVNTYIHEYEVENGIG